MLLDLKSIMVNHNLKITGALHVGAHTGQEYALYKECGIDKMCFFEPFPRTFERLSKNVPQSDNVRLFNCALGNETCKKKLYVSKDATCADNEGGSSSILKPAIHLQQYPHIRFDEEVDVDLKKLDDVIDNKQDYNFLNIDVQGFELEVLKGAEKTLDNIDGIVAEINRAEVYEGCSKVEQVDDYLSNFGFSRMETAWACETWGDAFYLKVFKM